MSPADIGSRPPGRVRAVLIAVAASALLVPQLAGAEDAQPFGAPPLVPIDPQDWDNQYDLTWDDFVPVPGVDRTDPDREPAVDTWRAALVLVDYPNLDFQITGQWDMMSQGSWNGPTGMHTRWKVPADGGSTVGPHHSIRNKLALGFIDGDDIVDLSRTGLASSGVVVAKVRARAAGVRGDDLLGVRVTFDGAAPLDRTPPCHPSTAGPECMGQSDYTNFTLEVVQQLGVDSYMPGNGVLIYKNKTSGTQCGTAPCFSWVIDPNPEDIGMVDFYQPDGTPRMVVTGDPRQVNDATFNAGTHSGTDFEWVDEDNRPHFYVVDVEEDADGVRTYTVAVRSLDGAGQQERGVALDAGVPSRHTPGRAATCTFPLENTGEAAPVDPAAHPSDVTDEVAADVYWLSVTSSGAGWDAELYNELAASRFGAVVEVPVYVTRTPGAARETTVTPTATFESDPSATATSTCVVDVAATTVRR